MSTFAVDGCVVSDHRQITITVNESRLKKLVLEYLRAHPDMPDVGHRADIKFTYTNDKGEDGSGREYFALVSEEIPS